MTRRTSLDDFLDADDSGEEEELSRGPTPRTISVHSPRGGVKDIVQAPAKKSDMLGSGKPMPPPANLRPGSAGRSGGNLNPIRGGGGPPELGDLQLGRGGSRSPSPNPLGQSHSMTNIGPGLSPSGGRMAARSGLGAPGFSPRDASPAPPAPKDLHSMTSIGPLDGRGRSPSPQPLSRPSSAKGDKKEKKDKKDKKSKKEARDYYDDDFEASGQDMPPPSPSGDKHKKDKKDKKDKKNKKDTFGDEPELGSGSYNFDIPPMESGRSPSVDSLSAHRSMAPGFDDDKKKKDKKDKKDKKGKSSDVEKPVPPSPGRNRPDSDVRAPDGGRPMPSKPMAPKAAPAPPPSAQRPILNNRDSIESIEPVESPRNDVDQRRSLGRDTSSQEELADSRPTPAAPTPKRDSPKAAVDKAPKAAPEKKPPEPAQPAAKVPSASQQQVTAASQPIPTKQSAPRAASQPHVKRFFLRFEPPTLAWMSGVDEKVTPIPINPGDLAGEKKISGLVDTLVKDKAFFNDHRDQIKVLLGRLASHMLPIFRIKANDGTQTLPGRDEPDIMSDEGEKLPKGALVLVHERKEIEGMKWLRLAVGGVWIAQDAAEEANLTHDQDARDWLQKISATSSGGLALQNAQAVVERLKKKNVVS